MTERDDIDPAVTAQLVAAAVDLVPGVLARHGGVFGDIATHLPGRRLAGVRIGLADEPVEVAVVVGLDRPIPAVVANVRRAVVGVCGDRVVDVTVADVRDPADPADPAVGPDPAPPPGGGRAVRREVL